MEFAANTNESDHGSICDLRSRVSQAVKKSAWYPARTYIPSEPGIRDDGWAAENHNIKTSRRPLSVNSSCAVRCCQLGYVLLVATMPVQPETRPNEPLQVCVKQGGYNAA